MPIRFFVFLFFLALIYFVQRFWFRALWRTTARIRSRAARLAARGVYVVVLATVVISFAERVSRTYFLPRTGPIAFVTSLVQVWLFASLLAFLCFGAVKAIEHLWFAVKHRVGNNGSHGPTNNDRRAFFQFAARGAAAIPLLAGLYGFASERFNFRVRRVEVTIAGLPSGLEGFQIVQLSDIHCGYYMPIEQVRRAVDIANELGAHMAVVTGDFISSEEDPLTDCISELGRLRAPLGVWGCNGNHEIYADAEDDAERLFQQHGMTLLRQQNRMLDFNGAKVNLIGVDYQRDHMVRGPARPMLDGIEPLIRRDMPNILLSHNPNSFEKAAELGIELSLSGHTHGGQVTVEILDKRYTPARFITPFTAGMYFLPANDGRAASNGDVGFRRAILYVNRGLGTFALPARIGVEPEITLLRLMRA